MFTRRTAVAMIGAAAAHAEKTVLEIVAPMAAALAADDIIGFFEPIAEDAPDRGKLRAYITALVGQFEITSSVLVKRQENGSAELDWYMELKSLATQSVIERRRDAVTVRVRNEKIQSLQPVDFFAPPRPAATAP
jgi:hypothetical protein